MLQSLKERMDLVFVISTIFIKVNLLKKDFGLKNINLGSVVALGITPDGVYLVTASSDRSIAVLDYKKRVLLFTLADTHECKFTHR